MLTLVEREQYPSRQTLKQEVRAVTIVAIVFAMAALLIMFGPHHRAFPRASTNTLSSAPDSSISMAPGSSQADRKQTNPFRGFRNVGSPQ
jgi:hypothetical protein